MQAVIWSTDLKQAIRTGIKQLSKKESDSFLSTHAYDENSKLAPQMAGKNGQEPGRPRLEYWD
jgi:hypothetical protein